MAWEKVGREEFWSEDNGTYGPKLFTNLRPARRHRITLEEKVNECCWKWRGAQVTGHKCTVTTEMNWVREAKFCPECGRKL